MSVGFGLPAWATALTAALAGLAIGFLYFQVLRRTVDAFVGGRGWLLPAGLTLARIAAMAAILIGAAWLGPLPLLASFVGFLIARAIALRYVREAG